LSYFHLVLSFSFNFNTNLGQWSFIVKLIFNQQVGRLTCILLTFGPSLPQAPHSRRQSSETLFQFQLDRDRNYFEWPKPWGGEGSSCTCHTFHRSKVPIARLFFPCNPSHSVAPWHSSDNGVFRNRSPSGSNRAHYLLVYGKRWDCVRLEWPAHLLRCRSHLFTIDYWTKDFHKGIDYWTKKFHKSIDYRTKWPIDYRLLD